MSDKAIILSVILAAVLCVAVPFIFRVCRYRRRMKTLIVPDGPSGEVAVGTVPTPEAEYLARYICLLVTRNFAASLFRNIKYFTLRKLYLCRKWMQKRLQKTITTGITLPNFDFLA